jgi:2-polyprenyl-6-methoxyphenol hydroxylase-like FAD-dependent oxidoreductase
MVVMDSITIHEWRESMGRPNLPRMNAPHRNTRAVIVGGGIAGPALALFLKRAGVEPVVLEAYPRADDVGGTFQIAPNGVRVLAELGLAEALVQAGAQPSRGFCFRNHEGRVIGAARTDRSGPAVNVRRAVLQRILRDEVERQRIAIAYGKRLRTVTLAGREVIAELEDGSSEIGDFLVGADGVGSRVRAWMLPDASVARYTGMVSVGGFCRESFDLPADGSTLTFMVGPKHQIGYGKFAPKLWAWWCHPQAESDAETTELTTMAPEALRARMADRYRGWSAPVAELIAATEAWLATPIFDVPRLPTWHGGRVVLLGDAAHAMSPAGGQGASMALADAMVLARLVASSPDVEGAFARFEALRRPKAEAFVKQGYANDRRSLRGLGPFGMWMRDRVLMPMMMPVLTRVLEKHYAAPLEA